MRLAVTYGLFVAGMLAFFVGPAMWLISPWPTKSARYVWEHWQAPRLALAFDQRDALLAIDIGNRYFGSTASVASGAFEPVLAGRAFRKALAIDPNAPWAHYQLARIAFINSDFNGALAEIDAELAGHQENMRSLYIRGLIYGYRDSHGDLAMAESDFRRFIEWAPSEWAGYNDLSWILAKEGKYADIETLMTSAFSSVPGGKENPWLWNELGVARLNLGDHKGAAEAFNHALTYAQALTASDWRAAYSGDSPTGDQDGLASFISGIRENLAAAGAASAPRQ